MFRNIKKIFLFLFISFSFFASINIKSNSFDFSREDSLDTVVMSASEFIEYITKTNVSAAEEEYLNNLFAAIKYENKIPLNCVTTSLNGNLLSIHASEYSYNDINDNVITWIPYKASVNNRTSYFKDEGDFYDCYINNISEEEEEVIIYYKANIYLDYNKVNVIINDAYNLASYYVSNNIIEEGENHYNYLYQEYLNKLEEYNEYLKELDKYNEDMLVYNKYLKELNIYNDLYDEYLNYLSEYESYQKELEDYNNYLIALENYPKELEKYQNYLIEKEKYDGLYDAYLEEYEVYSFEIAYVNYGLKIMEIINTPRTSLERSIYNDVMGDAVTQVLEKRDLLYSAGVDKSLIMGAENATYSLREIFTDYYSLESDEDKWIYYASNFTSIKNAFYDLVFALEGLYQDPIVRKGISSFDKEPQYLILISQLVYVNILLSGSNTKTNRGTYFNDSWTIDGKTKEEILENTIDFQLNNKLRTPIIKYYPIAPIPPTITEVKEPVYPTEVSKPVEPEVILEPTKPETIIEPLKPIEVLEPVEPESFECDETILNIIEDYKKGVLVYREEFSEDVCFSVSSTFTKKFKNSSSVTVQFYDEFDNYINSYTTEVGSYIIYDSYIPVKEADEIFVSYKFSHWEYEDNTVLDLNNVTKEGFVYPVFVGDVYKEYLITWEVDGDLTYEYYHFGDSVSYKGKLEKEYNNNIYYVFDKWDLELSEVSQDQKYVAIFKECYIVEEEGQGALIDYTDSLISIDVSSFELNNIDLSIFINQVIEENNSNKIRIIGDDFEILFSSTSFNKLCDLNLNSININIDDLGNYEYNYYIEFVNDDLQIIEDNIEFSSKFNGSFDNMKSIVYIENEDDSFSEVRANISNNSISFNSMKNNFNYSVYPLYTITIISNNCVNITSNLDKAKIGEYIDIDIELLVKGIYLEALIVTDSSGNRIEFSDDYVFIMPNKDLYVMASYQFYNYTVKFVSDGELISSKVYKYGDKVQVPSDPFKTADELYTYKFVSWDKEISLVTEDVTYTAVFERSEKEILVEPNKGPLVIVIVSLSLITISIIALIILKKKKLLFFKKKNVNVPLSNNEECVIDEDVSENIETNSIVYNNKDRKFKYKRKNFKR